MFEYSKYPILNILIPILLGMIGMSFCFNVINLNKLIEFSIILILFLITVTTFILSEKKRIKNLYFFISYNLLFVFIGAIFTVLAVNSAKEKYGDEWRYSVYKENPFQLKSAAKVQKSIHELYLSHGIKGDEGAVLEAMTIGNRENLSKSIKSNFSRAGAAHILALSGFHISIIYIILQTVFLSRIVTYKWKWISNILVIASLWVYAFISGMSPSLVRSVIMCTVLIIGTLHTNQPISLNGLALSALIMLCLNPLLIFHVGFQMSYLSMLGIYLLGIPLCKMYESYTFIDSFLWCTICITLSCTIFTLPIVSHVFGQISTLSIFTNIIITILTYIFFFTFIAWLITFAWPEILTFVLGTTSLMIKTVTYISSLSFSCIEVKFSLPTEILYYCILAIILIIINNFSLFHHTGRALS